MKKRVLAELGLGGGIVLESSSPHEAEPTIATLWITFQMGSDRLEKNGGTWTGGRPPREAAMSFHLRPWIRNMATSFSSS